MLNFRQEAMDEEFHPADTEKYLRLTSTPVYMVLAAVVLLTAALVMWAVMGGITVQELQHPGNETKILITISL